MVGAYEDYALGRTLRGKTFEKIHHHRTCEKMVRQYPGPWFLIAKRARGMRRALVAFDCPEKGLGAVAIRRIVTVSGKERLCPKQYQAQERYSGSPWPKCRLYFLILRYHSGSSFLISGSSLYTLAFHSLSVQRLLEANSYQE